ncbi:hypothetical protein ACP70R_009227 [Stipagrostis hirtigluma subsp. patula]
MMDPKKASVAEGGSEGGGDGVDRLHEELWLATAGPLVWLPAVGERVYYFPQGHIEQMEALKDVEVLKDLEALKQSSNIIPWKIPCRVIHVDLIADPDIDDIIANLTLRPEEQDGSASEGLQEGPAANKQPRPRSQFFCKTLTSSDIAYGALTIKRHHAEQCLPQLDIVNNENPEQTLVASDLHGKGWAFEHVFRGSPKRHVLRGGWVTFFTSKRLVSGDSLIFLRGENDELRIGLRRAMRQQNRTRSFCSKSSMHCSGISEVRQALTSKSTFTVHYMPRVSPAQFVLPVDRCDNSLKRDYSIGMPFQMSFEDEEAAVQTLTGKIIQICDDACNWANSKWRFLKVQWEKDGCYPDRVSPWEIEPDFNPRIANPPAPSRLKKHRTNVCPRSKIVKQANELHPCETRKRQHGSSEKLTKVLKLGDMGGVRF